MGGNRDGNKQHGAVFTAGGHGDPLRQIMQHNGGQHQQGGMALAAVMPCFRQQQMQRQYPQHANSKSRKASGRRAVRHTFRNQLQERDGKHGAGGKGQKPRQQIFPTGQQHPDGGAEKRPQHSDQRDPKRFIHGQSPFLVYILEGSEFDVAFWRAVCYNGGRERKRRPFWGCIAPREVPSNQQKRERKVCRNQHL